MVRSSLQRFVAFVAFALGICLPFQASAAILVLCEEDAMTLVPAQAQAQEANVSAACDENGDEEIGGGHAAPLCDPRGASVVAPPRIHAIADARIEAAPSCGGSEMGTAIGPSSQDPTQAGELGNAAPQGVLVPEMALPSRTEGDAPSAPTAVDGGPLAGFEHGIDHPPR
ncbi:MAG TPA: hypothetical protein VLS89_20205 [Candidatus Nanopelagicales bacterium]|nr:hypothetical protein [Candidatus Nanopelagicales bacterium]